MMGRIQPFCSFHVGIVVVEHIASERRAFLSRIESLCSRNAGKAVRLSANCHMKGPLKRWDAEIGKN